MEEPFFFSTPAKWRELQDPVHAQEIDISKVLCSPEYGRAFKKNEAAWTYFDGQALMANYQAE